MEDQEERKREEVFTRKRGIPRRTKKEGNYFSILLGIKITLYKFYRELLVTTKNYTFFAL